MGHFGSILELKCHLFGGYMPVNLSIKNVPDDLAHKLRQRASKNHRSIQGELIVILEEALDDKESLTPAQLLKMVNDMHLRTGPDSVGWVREDRDAR
jgi:plasmid stability protein